MTNLTSPRLEEIKAMRSKLERQLDALNAQISIGQDKIYFMKQEIGNLLEKVKDLQVSEFGKILYDNDPGVKMVRDMQRVRKDFS